MSEIYHNAEAVCGCKLEIDSRYWRDECCGDYVEYETVRIVEECGVHGGHDAASDFN